MYLSDFMSYIFWGVNAVCLPLRYGDCVRKSKTRHKQKCQNKSDWTQ